VVKRPGYLRLLVDEAPLPRYDEVLRDAATHAIVAGPWMDGVLRARAAATAGT
jgi:hypothetical protein